MLEQYDSSEAKHSIPVSIWFPILQWELFFGEINGPTLAKNQTNEPVI